MDIRNLLTTYRKRLAREGWIPSLLCGLICGFALNILCSVIFLFFGIRMFWISILVFLAGTAATTPIFYYKKFALNKRQVAARVDALGLEERILTMTQFENDDSYIARRQREDAINALKSVNSSFVKITVSASMVVAYCVTLVLGVGVTTASVLSNKSLITIIQGAETETGSSTFRLFYDVEDNIGGRIDGELKQTVNDGESGKIVQAVADDGYVFVGWTDGYVDATRIDVEVSRDIVVNAIFVEIESDEEEDVAEEEKREGNPGNKGNNSMTKDPENPKDGSSDGNGSGDGAGAGADAASNQVIDGSTYYGDEYNGSLSDAQDSMSSNGKLSGNEKGFIGDYFYNIQK